MLAQLSSTVNRATDKVSSSVSRATDGLANSVSRTSTTTELSSSKPAKEFPLLSSQSLLSLAQAMRTGLADVTYDRRWKVSGRLYKQCFLHSDAVGWMVEHGSQHLKTLTAESKSSPEESESISGDDPKELEEEAVHRLNQLLDAGYVSHVANKHRFTSSKRSMLYFQFHNDVIDEVERNQQRWKTTGSNEMGYSDRSLALVDRLEKLEVTTKRLNETVKSYSDMLDVANGKIAVLEETVASIGFALVLASLAVSALLVYAVANARFSAYVSAAISIAVIGLVSLVCGWSRFDRIKENLALLGKLMQPTEDIEESFRADYEKQEESSVVSAEGGKRETSVMRRMSTAILKQAPKELGKSFRKVQELPIQMRESSDLPDVSEWPHRPVMVCVNTPVSPHLKVREFGEGACPLGVPFHFTSDLFEGKCLLRFKDCPSDDPVADNSYFLGRRRLFQAIVQGKFKKEMPVSQVLTGHEFARPMKRLPPSWMIRAGTNLIRRLAPGTEFRLTEEQPRALAILAATAQIVSADQPGNEPDITDNDIKEDVSIFGGMFGDGMVTTPQRKKHLSDPKRAGKYTFDTKSVYTFDFYQSMLDCKDYALDLGFTKVGLSRILDGQPIQVLCKTVDGRYLWSFQIWNEQLVKEKTE